MPCVLQAAQVNDGLVLEHMSQVSALEAQLNVLKQQLPQVATSPSTQPAPL